MAVDKKSMAKVSVIIPVYNHARELASCLASLKQQTFQDFEVIVEEDREHLGAPVARNRGFSKSRGEYVLFSDADIVWNSDALEKMVRELDRRPEVSYVYASFCWGKKMFRALPFSAERLRQVNYIHTSALIRREHFPPNGFDESLKKFQDWDLWLTMLGQGHVGFGMPEVLMFIKPGGTMSSWLPGFVYQLPGAKFLFPAVKKYQEGREVIKKKHGL